MDNHPISSMTTSTLEKPQEIKSFTSLIHLREQLTKEAKNQERLTEFQKTIDEAIKDGDKKGVIEFTEKEWKTLITNENLPPFEEVQTLLKEKIKSAQEVTKEAKEKTGGIMGELQNKTGEVKDKAQWAIKEALSPIQKIKENFTKLGNSISEIWSNIWTPVKFAWYTLWATLGFKYGRDALASMTKEKAEKVVEEAKKKAGEIAGKWEEAAKEGKEGVMEKVWPMVALSAAWLSIFALLKSKLPTSMQNKLAEVSGDKKGFLEHVAKNRALRLFGVSGVALFGIGKLSEYIQGHGTELGEIPADEAGKKAWWTKAIEKAGVASHDLLDIVTGKKIAEKMQEENKAGYVALKDHEMVRDTKIQLEIVENRLEWLYHQDPNKIRAIIAALTIKNPALASTIVLKGWSILATILKLWVVQHPVALGLGIIAGMGSLEAIKNIEVKEDMTENDITEMVTDMSYLEEVNNHLQNYCPGEALKDHVATISRKLANGGAELKADIQYFWDNLSSNIEKWVLEAIREDDAEKICDVDEHGLAKLRTEILGIILQKNKTKQDPKNFEMYEALVGKDGKGGLLETIIGKASKKAFITESDIYDLMSATAGTDIRIFPENGSREWKTIQWVHLNERGTPIGFANNVCVNPLLSQVEKRAVAREFVYDPNQLDIWGTIASKWFEWTRELATKLANAISNKPDEAKNILEKMLGDKLGGFMSFGATAYFVDYLGNKYLLGPTALFEGIVWGLNWDNLEVTEALVDYAQWLTPVFVITGVKNLMKWDRILGRWLTGNILVETLAYPYKGAKWIMNAGRLIYHRVNAGDYAGILRDPAVILKDGIIWRIQHLSGKWLSKVLGMKHLGEHIELQGKLRELNAKLKRLKILHDIGAESSTDAFRIIDDIKDSIWLAKNEDIARELNIGPDDIKIGERKLDDLLKRTNDALGRVTTEIAKITPELKEKIRKTPDLLIWSDIPAKKWDLLIAKKLTEERITELENAKQKALQERQSGKMDSETWKRAERSFNRRTQQLTLFSEELRIRIEWHAPHGHVEGKWKWRAKGILWLAALAGIMVGVGKLRADQPGLEIPELDAIDEGQVDFFWFRSKDNIPSEKSEQEKSADEKKNKTAENKDIEIKGAPEYIRPFLETMQTIKGMYGTEFEFLCDPEALKKASDETIQTKVDNLTNIHEQMIVDLKQAIRENRNEIKRYLGESKKNDLIKITKGNLNAFFGLDEKNGNITLEYMDASDFKTTIWEMADFNHDNAEEILAGNYNGWDEAWYVTKRAAPISSEYYDGRDMLRNFWRGQIKNGFKSMGWLTFGAACDIGMIFSAGTTGFGKFGNAARAWVQWARLGKVLELIKISRTAVESGKLWGKVMGTILSKAITHSGTFMLGGMGADTAHQTIVFPRSQSVKIDDL